jgi:hypothetical protein
MSKAIAAQPGTVLLSEVSPVPLGGRFIPFDPLQQFIRNYGNKEAELRLGRTPREFVRRIFMDRIEFVLDICTATDRRLVLRDHSHSDFLAPTPTPRSSLLECLDERGFRRRSVLTLRDPVDAYVSSQRENWVRHAAGFDDYCRRTSLMIAEFDDDAIFLYEDFCADPVAVTERICSVLALPFDPQFQDRLASIQLTGDSGRRSDVIAPRPRRPVPPDLKQEIEASPHYAQLRGRFWPRSVLA